MKLARTAALSLAALGLTSLQLALGAAAQADDLGGLTLQQWSGYNPGQQSEVMAPGDHEDEAIWVSGPAGSPVNAKVLVAVKPVGAQSPALPKGVTLTFPTGSCTPAVPGTDPAQAAAFLCDMAAPATGPTIPPGPPTSTAAARADVDVQIGAGTPDATKIELSQTLVPHGDTTLAQVEADQQAGKITQTGSHLLEVESKERAAQDKSTFQLSDFTAGQSVVQTVKLHSVDNSDVVVTADDAVAGQTWYPSPKEQIDLPQGLDMLSATADNGVSCKATPVAYQHTTPVEGRELAICHMVPGDATLKLTFKADAALQTTQVKLHSGYAVYASKPYEDPFSDATGTFTVNAAPAAATSAAPSSPAASVPAASVPAAAATPSAAASQPAAAAAATPSASAKPSAAGAQSLAFTGAAGTVTYAVGGAVVLAAGAGILVATRRRSARG
ncbi:hypothetical protein ACFZB9_29220 [Kitasatospora sp. NPDC008050]|uniref:hypothetical protein n=1 Tax=Kitasatospora sp. NPDC008050 TaxID=3364021 RepID=UPI0036DFD2BB